MVLLLGWLFCIPKELFENTPYSTVLLDKNGEMLSARIADDGQWRFPPTDTIPEKYRIALVEFEDKYFYYHPGVNPLAIGRALIQNINSGSIESGGSTITMQVIRMSRGRERNIWQKIMESIMATRLEARYSKEEILCLYASNAPFGGNVVGIDAALWRYWGRSNHEISWAEAATLAVLPNAPSSIHIEKNRPALLAKRNRLLKRLFEKGIIDESAYYLSIEEPLPEGVCAIPNHSPHLADYVANVTPGQRIQTDIDIHLQTALEDLLSFRQKQNSVMGYDDMAAVIIDIDSGTPIAYCGNADYTPDRHGSQVDILRSPRSTGSLLKPFLYKYLIEKGLILPTMLIPDVPLATDGFAPQNFDYNYRGAVPADKALKASLNIPAVNELQMVSISEFADHLRDLGMTTLKRDNSEYGLSLILGGAEGTLLELTQIYSNIAKNAYQPASWYTLNALKDDKYDIAWKTGTSYGFRDAWAIGVNKNYAVGVWVGNASGSGAPNLTGATVAVPVMFDIFNLLPQSDWFDNLKIDNSITKVKICRQSGNIASEYCRDCDTIYVSNTSLSVKECPYHKPICLTADGLYRTTPANSGAHIENMFILPPIMEHYYMKSHPEYKPLPPYYTTQGTEFNESSLTFITPKDGSRILLPRQLDGSTKGILVKIAQNSVNSTLHWFLDDNYIGSTKSIHDMDIKMSVGKHTIVVIDEYGNKVSSNIEVFTTIH